jgi:hypothetical protein
MAKRNKSVNGVGRTVTFDFDETDAQEHAALHMSQHLASRHGRRKAVLISALAAMQSIYESSGRMLAAHEVHAALLAYAQATSGQNTLPEPQIMPIPAPSAPVYVPTAVQVVEGSSGKAKSEEVAKRMVGKAANLGFF